MVSKARPHYRPSRNHKALWTFPFKNQNLRVVATSRTSANCEIRASHFCLVLLAFVERQKPERAGPFDCTRRSPPEKNRSDREALRFESAAVSRVAVGHDHQQQSFAKFGGRARFVPRLDSSTRRSKRSLVSVWIDPQMRAFEAHRESMRHEPAGSETQGFETGACVREEDECHPWTEIARRPWGLTSDQRSGRCQAILTDHSSTLFVLCPYV